MRTLTISSLLLVALATAGCAHQSEDSQPVVTETKEATYQERLTIAITSAQEFVNQTEANNQRKIQALQAHAVDFPSESLKQTWSDRVTEVTLRDSEQINGHKAVITEAQTFLTNLPTECSDELKAQAEQHIIKLNALNKQ